MPYRLSITFPDAEGGKDITFICDSGDYDGRGELHAALKQVRKKLAPAHGKHEAAVIEWELV